jgi:hypothetical protein
MTFVGVVIPERVDEEATSRAGAQPTKRWRTVGFGRC